MVHNNVTSKSNHLMHDQQSDNIVCHQRCALNLGWSQRTEQHARQLQLAGSSAMADSLTLARRLNKCRLFAALVRQGDGRTAAALF